MSVEVETMFVARQLAWHGLGTFVPEAVDSEEALKISGLDWQVELQPLYTEVGEMVEGHKLTVRDTDQKVLGVVGDRYTVIQNHELFDISDKIAEYGARYESAGSLREGKNIFTTMVIERPLVVEGDVHIPYLVMASSHDGSMATKALLSPVRVVCMNTLRLAIARSHRTFTIRHTASAQRNMAEARRALDLSFKYYDGFELEVQALMAQVVTDEQFDEIIEKVFPLDILKDHQPQVQKKRDGVKATLLHDPTVSPYRGTAWGALNAFNSWELWTAPVRRTKNTSTTDKAARQERQALNVMRDSSGLTEKVNKLLVAVR